MKLRAKHNNIYFLTIFLTISLGIASCGSSDSIPNFTSSNTGPYILNAEHLELIKDTLEHDPLLQESFSKLMQGADSLLTTSFEYVTDKKEAPDGGSINDYMSIHRYSHIDSQGNPYYDESKNNPLVDEYDRVRLSRFSSAVYTLSLAYFYSNDEKYAEKASQLISNWFFETETRMNPHLDYAQVRLGQTGTGGGGSQGIIDANDFILVIEAVSLLYDSYHWNNDNHKNLKEWFYHFSEWIQRNYNADAYSTTNISTWMDVQRSVYLLFTEQEDRLNSNFHVPPVSERIQHQISPMGIQAYESGRPRSQHYVYFNLRGFMNLANIRKNRTGNDRDWPFLNSDDHGGLKPALDQLVDYVDGSSPSQFFDTNPNFDSCRYLEIFKPAAVIFNAKIYDEAAQKLLNRGCRNSNISLTYPALNLLGS